MTSSELKSEDVLATLNQTRKNIEELAEGIKKYSDDKLAMLAGIEIEINQIEKTCKEANKYYLYLEKEKEEDDTLVSEELRCRLDVLTKSINDIYDLSELLLEKSKTSISSAENKSEEK
ncbi:hypothetical protein ISN45_Aa03g035190 [Arabidopsis thaliana x Arabidopsis arenosa]|uniref:Uncharacterized protein n=1 Tax=Arabidopsis thaliana x Arabidopsis arenosa TaxID=1240361 RepID=A0A8T2AXE1_9BRAS|nr:hypothetical protein ISN45_Aa03g035190 [Arabidopsis thaliana x Arabidopsis arenosa]